MLYSLKTVHTTVGAPLDDRLSESRFASLIDMWLMVNFSEPLVERKSMEYLFPDELFDVDSEVPERCVTGTVS